LIEEERGGERGKEQVRERLKKCVLKKNCVPAAKKKKTQNTKKRLRRTCQLFDGDFSCFFVIVIAGKVVNVPLELRLGKFRLGKNNGSVFPANGEREDELRSLHN
jgi:hypothetical protein